MLLAVAPLLIQFAALPKSSPSALAAPSTTRQMNVDGFRIDQHGLAGGEPFPSSLQIAGEGGASIHFATTLPSTGEGYGAVAQITYDEDFPRVWVPHIAPEEGNVIGDHSLRSPAIILANAKRVVALIPEIDDLAALQKTDVRAWLDFDAKAKRIRVAAGAHKPGTFHVSYERAKLAYHRQKVRVRVHLLTSTAKADIADPYGMVSRYLWRTHGRSGFLNGGSQRAPFDRYEGYVTNWAFAPEPKGWGDTVWQSFTIDGRECGAPAFIVDVAQHPSVPVDRRRWREQRSVWNQAWFSTQRSANGLLRYARSIASADLERRARLMTQFALAAPQSDGLFPSVYTTAPVEGGKWYQLYRDTPSWEKGRWTNSDRRPPGTSGDAIHLLDASFTARLLLEWHDLVPEDREVLPYIRRYADRLVRLQAADGSFPGWIEPDGRVSPQLAAGPESAMSASLLIELASKLPKSDRDVHVYIDATKRALAYLRKGPIAESRWEDFETYYSCSRWGEDRVGQKVARNNVYKSNTFSPFWCAEAFLAGSKLFGDKSMLATGQRCLDELSLYQQVWEPPTIPAPTHGGFGVMNGDGEWNDARQSLFAPLYLAYYRATGQPEYYERGVSALRASFAMMYCPENTQVKAAYERVHPFFGPESYGFMMENIAHGGPATEAIGPFNIYTWGNGAALAAAAGIKAEYGDAFIDLKRKQAFGIDGCSATIQGGRVILQDRYGRSQLAITSDSGERRTIKLADGKASVLLADL